MTNATITQAFRIGIFLAMLSFLFYLLNRDRQQQVQIDHNIRRDSLYYAKSDSMLTEIYKLAVGNKLDLSIHNTQIKALEAKTAGD